MATPAEVVGSIAFGLGCVIVVLVLAAALLANEQPTFRCDCCQEELPMSERFVDATAPEHAWCRACVEDEGLEDVEDESEAA